MAVDIEAMRQIIEAHERECASLQACCSIDAAARGLLAVVDSYERCDCGKPRMPGPCSGNCDREVS